MREVPGNPQQFPAKRPHFFKILFPSYLHELPIPRRFIQKFREELSDVALLKGPSGRVWRVELKETDGIVYFLKGWKEFVDSHSLSIGYLLVFRYDGNSQFNVLIFDRSACEKEYPYATENDEESCSNNGSCSPEKKSDDSVEIVGVSKIENRVPQKTKRGYKYMPRVLRSSLRLQSNAMKMKLNSEAKSKDNNENKRKDTSEELLSQSESRQSKSQKSVGSESLRQVESLDHLLLQQEPGGNKVIQPNGKGLMESIHKNVSDCSKEKTPSEPTPVASENESTESYVPSSGEKISVKIENQESKPVGVSSSSEEVNYFQEPKEGVMPRKRRACSKFIMSRRGPLAAERKQKALTEATKFNSDNPFFMVVITSSHLRNGPRMQVPTNFAEKHFSGRERYICLESSDGRKWSVGCLYRPRRALFLSGGWSAFLFDNNIEEGDVCAFELVNRKENALKVTVYPVDEVLPLNQLSQKWSRRRQT
eukprot:TRINITY_DN19129_c0_g1_i3.p1 TRINITY_DN19129_c0_g1~~TRINITY_DN19129_c0_g1_i3.p1  ORF type:complete len:480 (+),score=94.54 TRINITY_DN19129_c0_g1_i3:288-1727(+)